MISANRFSTVYERLLRPPIALLVTGIETENGT
jgi:hypothetical protein